MDIDKLETHDRYQEFTKKDFDIGKHCQNIIDQRPFGSYPFYIFAHARTEEDGVTKRLIWQPRLTKPKSQTNSMLFKAYPSTDLIEVIWLIPDRELWSAYEEGKITENKIVSESIHAFQYDRASLDRKDPQDLSDEVINKIYIELAKEGKKKRFIQKTAEAAQSLCRNHNQPQKHQ